MPGNGADSCLWIPRDPQRSRRGPDALFINYSHGKSVDTVEVYVVKSTLCDKPKGYNIPFGFCPRSDVRSLPILCVLSMGFPAVSAKRIALRNILNANGRLSLIRQGKTTPGISR